MFIVRFLLQYLLQFVEIIHDSYNTRKLHLEDVFLISDIFGPHLPNYTCPILWSPQLNTHALWNVRTSGASRPKETVQESEHL
jgi:hypothetical protein